MGKNVKQQLSRLLAGVDCFSPAFFDHLLTQTGASPNYLPALQRELVDVVGRYVNIDPSDIKVRFERQGAYEVLEVKVELPEPRA